MTFSAGLMVCVCGIAIMHFNDIAESAILTNDHDIGPYIRTLRQYPADFFLTQFEKAQLPNPVMEYLNSVSNPGYAGIGTSNMEQQKRSAQAQPLPMKVRITRAGGIPNRFSRLRRGSQGAMLGIGIGDHMARL